MPSCLHSAYMEAAQSSKKVATPYMSTWDYAPKVPSLFTPIN